MSRFILGLLLGVVCLGGAGISQDAATETPVAAAPAETPAEGTAEPAASGGDTAPAATGESPEAAADAKNDSNANFSFAINNLTLMFCAVLVLAMQAGFAMVEVGLNPAKHAVNILCKNTLDLAVGVILFFAIGYAIMYPGFAADGGEGEYFKVDTNRIFAITPWDGAAPLHPQVDFLFQVAFAATAATIVSGAVAGRMKFVAYLIYSAVITAFVYPVSGSWKWGYGFLHDMGFHDFAGSVVVHACGGFAALAGAIVLGARTGRFTKDGRSIPMPGHNLSLATLGVFILLVGWYGFNPGSQLAFNNHTNVGVVMTVATNTTLAAASGGVVCLVAAWAMFGKPDLTMALNGILGGLVGITANCDCVSNSSALIIGAVAGVVVLAGIVALEKLKIDDPVGAFPVHGLCGIWGCLAAGIFGGKPMGAQITGTVVIVAWSFLTMLALFLLLKAIGLLRVSQEDEMVGLDLSEHGMHAYGAEGGPNSK
ncbi:ammonium transporter [Pirellulaceae bacterium SH501]